MKNYWLIPIMVLCLFSVGGCAEGLNPLNLLGLPAPVKTGIGETTTDEKTKATVKDYPKPMQETWNACLASAGDMKLNISNQKFDSQGSLLEAKQPPQYLGLEPEYNVRVELIQKDNQTTTVKVRFESPGGGWFKEEGCADWQKEFHKHMMTHLAMGKTWEIR